MIAQRVADVVTVEASRSALNAAAAERWDQPGAERDRRIVYEMKEYRVAISRKFEPLGHAPGLPVILGAPGCHSAGLRVRGGDLGR
ncbi:MAG TPA: hypothetical protein VI172_04270 [Candidatus Dormibacteraeota bacterium]